MNEYDVTRTDGTSTKCNNCGMCGKPFYYYGDYYTDWRNYVCQCKSRKISEALEEALERSIKVNAPIWEALAEYDRTGELPT